MFTELRIVNFAVLKDLSVSLETGLNVVTGETGAGKSIVVDALEVLLGGRALSGIVRSGEPRALVEGVVDIRGLREVAALIDQLGLESGEGDLILRREVRAEGRSRGWVNGSPVTATVLRRIGSLLVDIHGQHEHQRLLSADFQQEVLDAFGECRDLAGEVETVFRRITRLKDTLAAHEERRRELEARAGFIRFQLGEILDAGIRAGEDEDLRIEANRLANADLLAREGHALHELLHGGDGAVTDHLAEGSARLRRLCDKDPSLAPHLSTLEDAYHRVSDAAAELARYAARVAHDPSRLQSLRERQALLERLQRRHGPSLADVTAKGETLQRELDELETAGLDAESIARKLAGAEAAWSAASAKLSRKRREAADRLSREVVAAFPGLGLEGARFEVRFDTLSAPAARGCERVRFMAAMNPGFPPAPLSRIASGGELSRVMLVLKSVLAGIDDLPTLVFDEIDAGIGGVVAGRVGERLREVARGRQVLVVTHLARIAVRASNHLLVEKRAAEGTAATVLTRLDGEERVREIARMLGGDPDSQSSLDHARQLLPGAGRD